MLLRRQYNRKKSALSRLAAIVIGVVIIVAAVGTYAALSAGGLLAGCPSAVKFGATLSLTGTLSAFGTEQSWTLNATISDINGYGGIPLSNGCTSKATLTILDDASDPNTALHNLQTLVSSDHANVILGELGGVQDSVAQTFTQLNQIPYIGPVYFSSAKSGTNSWIFAPFQNETNEAHRFLNWFYSVDKPNATNHPVIAFIGEGDPAAAANNLAGEAYARALGFNICGCSDLNFQPLSTSAATTFITQANDSGHNGGPVDAVYGLPLPPDAVLLAQTAKSLTFVPKAWLLTRGTAVAPFAVQALGGLGSYSDYFFSSFPWHPLDPYNGTLLGHTVTNAGIVGRYLTAFGHPPTLEGVYYTEVTVAADAIAKAGSLDASAIRQALRTTTFDTVMGKVSFTLGGQWVQSDQYIQMFQWQSQKLQIVLPLNISTSSIQGYPFPPWSQPRT